MILQKDIQYWRDYGGDLIAGIPLKKLEELRQQLKDELSKEMRPYHVPILLKVVDEVLGVEGEK